VKIIDENFKMQTARGGVFGKGLYFAEDAGKSIVYTGSGDEGCIFVVRALVGYSQPNLTKEDQAKAANNWGSSRAVTTPASSKESVADSSVSESAGNKKITRFF